MELSFTYGEGSEVSWIRNEEYCKIPQDKSLGKGCYGGSSMINLALRLCCLLRIEKIHLIDGAFLKACGGIVNLSFLYMLKYGKTWYQSFGFDAQLFSDQGIFSTSFQKAVETFRNTTKKDLMDLLAFSYSFFTVDQSGVALVWNLLNEKQDISPESKFKDWGPVLLLENTHCAGFSIISLMLIQICKMENILLCKTLNQYFYKYLKKIGILFEKNAWTIDTETACKNSTICASKRKNKDETQLQNSSNKRAKQ